MANEAARHRLFEKLLQLLGTEEAATLMEHLHPERWNELATKADLARLPTKEDLGAFATKRDLDAFATKFATRDDLEAFPTRAEVDLRFEGVRHRIDAAEHRMIGAVRGEMSSLVTSQTRALVFALVGAITANAMLVLGAVRLG